MARGIDGETHSLLEQRAAAGARGDEEDRSSSSGRFQWLRSRPFATASAALGLLGILFATLAVGTKGGILGSGGGGGLQALDLAQPYLGALDCEAAFTVPAEGPSDRFSYTFVKLISMAEFVYVLCVDCDKIAVPSPWRDKVRLVNGRIIDECVQDFNVDHWHRATFSHAVAVADARTKGYNNVAIVEEDSRSDFTVVFSDSDYEEFQKLLKSPAKWNFIRLGWRPYGMAGLEGDNKDALGCPQQCRCASAGARMCVLQGPGCDLRSSDAYFITRGAFNDYIHRLQQGVVDFDVLQSFDKMMLVNPMVSYQEKLDISMNLQRKLQSNFKLACVHDPIINNANGANAGLNPSRQFQMNGGGGPQ